MANGGPRKLLLVGLDWGLWVARIESGISYSSFRMVVWYEVLGWTFDGVLVLELSLLLLLLLLFSSSSLLLLVLLLSSLLLLPLLLLLKLFLLLF